MEGNAENDDGSDLVVPEGVLRALEHFEKGETASKEDLESVLKF